MVLLENMLEGMVFRIRPKIGSNSGSPPFSSIILDKLFKPFKIPVFSLEGRCGSSYPHSGIKLWMRHMFQPSPPGPGSQVKKG